MQAFGRNAPEAERSRRASWSTISTARVRGRPQPRLPSRSVVPGFRDRFAVAASSGTFLPCPRPIVSTAEEQQPILDSEASAGPPIRASTAAMRQALLMPRPDRRARGLEALFSSVDACIITKEMTDSHAGDGPAAGLATRCESVGDLPNGFEPASRCC